ncbi:MAG: hypothetical protein JRE40_04955 [Deltaproteobacteria bacterium]|nr:hypothetical protein [Deltaproteobacteria bacterium]
MYKVMNAKRTAKVDAPSMEEAAARFLKLPVDRLFVCTETHNTMMLGVCTEDWSETDERVAVFEIEEER